MTDAPQHVDIAVVGAGPAGLAAALALSEVGARVALIAPATPASDWRTTALLGSSVDFFARHGVWTELSAAAFPLKRMRLIDATERLLRAPDVTFDAREIGKPEYGHNVSNGPMVAALAAAVARRPDRITRIDALFEGLNTDGSRALLSLSTGQTVSADLVVAADGRKSRVRDAAGIDVKSWAYPQEALVLCIQHSQPHQDTSIEFHTTAGPFTLVPHGEGRSSLVWMDEPAVIARAHDLDDAALALEIERRSASVLGKVSIDSPRQRWPISGFRARQLAAGRVVLVGEAAHGFPPIGAQGFNLSIRDIETLADLVRSSLAMRATGAALDGAAVAKRYGSSRRSDVIGRVTGVDLLNRSLLSGFLPMQIARAGGLLLARDIAPLRRLLMRVGLGAHP